MTVVGEGRHDELAISSGIFFLSHSDFKVECVFASEVSRLTLRMSRYLVKVISCYNLISVQILVNGTFVYIF